MFQYLVVYRASAEMQKGKVILSSEQCLEGLRQIRQIHWTIMTKQILCGCDLSCTVSEMGYIWGVITYDWKIWA